MSDARPAEHFVVLDALLAQLHDAGHDVTPRTLESWRYKRLIPRLARVVIGGRAVWAYHDRAVAHVVAACELRRRVDDLDVLRLHLWLRGFEQEPEDIRRSIVACLCRMDAVISRELNALRRTDGDAQSMDPEAITALAASLARKRGSSPVPRFVRQSLHERTKGVEYLLRLSLLGGHDLDVSGAEAAEKVLGISRRPAARSARCRAVAHGIRT